MNRKTKAILPLAAAGLLTFGSSSRALFEDEEDWETDDLTEDDYGYYDSDFEWGVEDEDEWSDWYGDAEQDWGAYDDPGEEGWFDW